MASGGFDVRRVPGASGITGITPVGPGNVAPWHRDDVEPVPGDDPDRTVRIGADVDVRRTRSLPRLATRPARRTTTGPRRWFGNALAVIGVRRGHRDPGVSWVVSGPRLARIERMYGSAVVELETMRKERDQALSDASVWQLRAELAERTIAAMIKAPGNTR